MVETPRGLVDPVAPVDDLTRGSLIGRYVVLDKVGAGGMGIVYAAYDPELDRRVALKLVHAKANGTAGAEGRIQREAQALARLAHPNVVAVYDVGSTGERLFLAMELVDGDTLQQWVGAELRTWREIVDVLIAAGAVVAAAHDAGVVHRDFKPTNVLVGRDRRVRVLDFGLACATDEPAVSFSSGRTRHGALGDDLTVTGSVLGTPLYMPPEAERAEAVGPAGDQFSFCITLYEALYGERPFKVRTRDELPPIPPAPAGSDVPEWLRAVVVRGLAVKPEDRHPSMNALLAALRADPVRHRRRIGAGAALGAVAAAAIAGTIAWQARAPAAAPDDPCDDFVAPLTDAKVDAATAEALAGWSRDWTSERSHACSATRVEHTQSEAVLLVRLSCLDRQLADTRAVVTLIEGGDPALARQGPGAVRQMPRAAVCANASAVSVVPAPPEELRARVDALNARLLHANALDRVGRRSEALAELTPIVADARTVGHGPELAEALLAQCRVLDNLNEQTAAVPACAEAELVAMRSRMDAVAARAAAMRVELLAFSAHDPVAFDTAVAGARAWVERDHDLLAELSLEQGLGIANTASGKHEAAIEHIHRAAQVAVQLGNEDSSTVQALWNNEAFELTLLGRYDEALALQEKAIAALENPVRDTDLLAHLLDNYGYNLVMAGRAAKARAPLDRALAMDGLSPFVHGGLLCDLARIDLAENKPKDAIARCEDGLARLRQAGTVKFNLAINEDPLAAAYLADGRAQDALALGQECLAEYRKDQKTDGPEMVPCMAVVGGALLALGKPADARAQLEHALEIQKGHIAPNGVVEAITAQLARIGR